MMKRPNFENVLTALGDQSKAFPERYLPLLSDLPPKDVSALMAQWPELAKERKWELLDDLVKLYLNDSLVSFDALAAPLLSDPDERIRTQALRLLSDSDDIHLLPRLTDMAENDPAADVRIRAVSLLSSFVELGELDEIPSKSRQMVEDCLLRVLRSELPDVQRAALEAVAYSSRPEVETLIQSAYIRSEPKWVASGLVAMGHSANERWEELVLSKLGDANTDIRRSAIRAAGELRIDVARQILLNLLDEEDDDEIIALVVWSLSQIGGDDVRITLETLLDQAEDEDVIEYLEEALDNLDFTEQLNAFGMLSIDPDDESDIEDLK
jgi:HEAT repeat protein